MFFIMTLEKTLPLNPPKVFIKEPSHAVGEDYRQVKIYEAAVVCRIALGSAYPVGVVTGRTGRLLVDDM